MLQVKSKQIVVRYCLWFYTGKQVGEFPTFVHGEQTVKHGRMTHMLAQANNVALHFDSDVANVCHMNSVKSS